MGEIRLRWHGLFRAASVLAWGGLLAACSQVGDGPAPVYMRGAESGISATAPTGPWPRPTAGPPGAARQIVVQPGQSVGRIAEAYHVSKQAIIDANHLTPPYKIKSGAPLLIPGGGAPPVQQAMAPPTAGPPVATAAAMSPAAAAGHAPPEVIPLDGPASPKTPPAAAAASSASGPALFPPPASTAVAAAPSSAAPREPSAADQARAEATPPALPRGARFPWPVRGRVLAGYGAAADGGHNDGINIAAPRGAPVTAIDSGVVAYAGNELRGYGNLILIKHANGWISAYAHCDELLVKKGDPVYRGKMIAKVGTTGGVGEPQLHFELRQGKRPVDPRGLLDPAPSA